MSEPPPEHNFDLLRKLIAADHPDRLSLFDACAHRFRSLHPDDDIFQFLIATSFLAVVMREVPEKVAEVLAQHEATTRMATDRISQVANQKLDQFEKAGQIATRLNGQVQRLEAVGNDVMTRLEAATAAHAQAALRIDETKQQDGMMFWIGVLLVVVVIAFAVGFFCGRHA